MNDDQPDNSLDACLDRAIGATINPEDHEGNAPQPMRSGNGDNSRLNVYDRMEADGKGKGKDAKGKDDKAARTAKEARDLQKRAHRDGIDDALDVATGKKEKTARADKDDSFKTDKDGKPRIYSAKTGEDGQLLDGIIDRAQGKVAERKPFDRREFAKPEARAVREELKARFPNAKLSDHLKAMEHWHEAFQKDAVGAREQLMQAYLNVSPEGFAKYEPKAGKASDPKYAQGEAIDRATADSADLEDLKAYADKYGSALPDFIRQFLEFEKGMVADPVGTSARLAANYGALRPEPAQQAPQSSAAAQPAQAYPRTHAARGFRKRISGRFALGAALRGSERWNARHQ